MRFAHPGALPRLNIILVFEGRLRILVFEGRLRINVRNAEVELLSFGIIKS